MPTVGVPDRAALARAWQDVLANDAGDGTLAPGVARFAEDVEENLDRLAADLATAAWRPNDLTAVNAVVDERERVFHVPSARDRVVERAVLDVVTPLVDPWLGPAAFAYRPGLGVAHAVQAVAALRDEGGRFVLRADVHDCFPSVPVDRAQRLFECLVGDEPVLEIVRALLMRSAVGLDGRRAAIRGLPLGCALSPMLTNLVLTQLDEPLLDAGFSPVRYADDLAVVTETSADAWEAARVATAALKGMGMELGADKTAVMSFDEGFCFLGEDFGPRYPPSVPTAPSAAPDRRVVYVAMQGSRVRVQQGRFRVQTADEVDALDVPTGQVARVVAFGAVGFSAGARNWALGQGVETVFASRRGTYLGNLVPAAGRSRSGRLRAQVHASDDAGRVLVLAHGFAEAKIVKQAVLLRKFGRRDHAEAVREAANGMMRLTTMLSDCVTLDEVRGVEGAAARFYFPAFGSLFPEGLRFGLRSRQPPGDVANAALSYLYTVLLGESATALRAAGLDPTIGFLHADDDARPSLALDLMEELRPLIVDHAVLTAARRRSLLPDHGRTEAHRPGVLLTKAGRTAVVDAYETRMLQTTAGALPDFSGSLRRHIYRQAQRLVRTILDPTHAWTGLSWR